MLWLRYVLLTVVTRALMVAAQGRARAAFLLDLFEAACIVWPHCKRVRCQSRVRQQVATGAPDGGELRLRRAWPDAVVERIARAEACLALQLGEQLHCEGKSLCGFV